MEAAKNFLVYAIMHCFHVLNYEENTTSAGYATGHCFLAKPDEWVLAQAQKYNLVV